MISLQSVISSQMRRRINYEKVKAIYNEDMDRKIKFIMRKNRLDPWVGATWFRFNIIIVNIYSLVLVVLSLTLNDNSH